MPAITAESANWSSLQKVAFRFFFVFFVFFIFLDPNNDLPYVQDIFNFYVTPFNKLILWLAKIVLHINQPLETGDNGSGDTTFANLLLLFVITTAFMTTIIWTIAARNTKNYNKLLYWLCVVVRYYMAVTMISYGFFKVIKLQFPAPTLRTLIQPLGTMSPMKLAWTYMGYSTAYNYFTGFAEITCGLLLFFRKTSTLGAVIGLAVAGNIMAINYCFDVPVKIVSTILVLMCLFLMVKEAPRLINFFFRNKEALPANLTPHRFKTRWKNIVLTVVKVFLIGYTIIFNWVQALGYEKQFGTKAPHPPLYGLYQVESFVKDKDTLPPLTTDTIRWSKFIVGSNGSVTIKLMNDSLKNFSVTTDTVKHKVVMHTFADTAHKFTFTYSLQKPDIMLLQGKWKQDSVRISLHKLDPNNFLLLKRGFHWVNETPFNR